jgi:MFS family permease
VTGNFLRERIKRSKFMHENSPAAAVNPDGRRRRMATKDRAALLAMPNFRVFYVGYTTSLLGSSMATVALIFAVLGSGGSATDLGYVSAANTLPLVAFMLGGGVIADRLGRRQVMLVADISRFAAQVALAIVLFTGRPPVWVFVVLSAIRATGQAMFAPAFGALTPEIAPRDRLADANALLGVCESAAQVGGPALAGVLIGVSSPAAIIAVDAASYAASVLALWRLRIPQRAAAARRSPLHDLAEGWQVFRSRTWLWVVTVQFSLFNLFTWAPYLLLGPVLAASYLGGPKAWGLIISASAAAALLTGLALTGRRPRRLMTVAVAGTFGYSVPVLMLALHGPLWAVAAGSAVAGAGSTVFGTYDSTAMQQHIPAAALARVRSLLLTGSYGFGAAGFVIIGPLAARTGITPLLAFAAAWNLLSSAVVLWLPAIRRVTWRD